MKRESICVRWGRERGSEASTYYIILFCRQAGLNHRKKVDTPFKLRSAGGSSNHLSASQRYIHTYIHTHIYIYIHTYIHTYIHDTCIHTYIH